MGLKAITREDVLHIVTLARAEPDEKDGASVTNAGDISTEEMLGHTEKQKKLVDAIDALGEEGCAELTALMLLGRESAGTEDFEQLKQYHGSHGSGYVASKRHLSDFLMQGLDKLDE